MEDLYELTGKIIRLIVSETDTNNRITLIDQINNMLDERQGLINSFEAEEMEKQKMIVQQDRELKHHLNNLFEDIKKDLFKIKHQKEINSKYNGYIQDNMFPDGVFVEKNI